MKKTEIAYQIANLIDKDLNDFEKGTIAVKRININKEDITDSMNYLVKAIQYAAGN